MFTSVTWMKCFLSVFRVLFQCQSGDSFTSVLLRLVCSLAALLVQVQVPAWACWRRHHAASWNSTVRNQEWACSKRADTESTPDCTPKSCLPREHFIDHPGTISPTDPALYTTQGARGHAAVTVSPSRHQDTLIITRLTSWFQRDKPFTVLSISECHLFICLIMYSRMYGALSHGPPVILQ